MNALKILTPVTPHRVDALTRLVRTIATVWPAILVTAEYVTI